LSSPYGAVGAADPVPGAGPKIDIQVVDQFSDKRWRMNNLYFIVNEDGKQVKFMMNDTQATFFEEMWYLNIILKARQLGFTTFIMLYMLDECLFYENQTAGVIAHTLDDSKKLFRNKIDFPYKKLPEGLRTALPADNDTAQELVFGNGSAISVGVSMRSGTLQYLLVSEFGKISANWPDKAREIKTGAFNTVHTGNYVFVESTAQGKEGEFWEMCDRWQKWAAAGKPLSKMDFKFHFHAWWRKPEYRLPPEDAKHVVYTSLMLDYFEKLKKKHGIELDDGQKAWYLKKHETLGDDMKREHPSTWEEAFEVSVEGAYFYEQMQLARRQGRITKVPIAGGVAVDTWWDLGVRDKMAIWFSQTVGREIRFVHYYENDDIGMPHYVKYLHEWRDSNQIIYGKMVAPHDIEVREMMTGMTRKKTAQNLGIRFIAAPQMDHADQVEAGRTMFNQCWFDEASCDQGITCLDNYRKEWNETLGVWSDKARHDWASHGASAFMTFAVMHNRVQGYNTRARAVQDVSSGGWT
jgi:hypothetical protein